MDRQRNTIETLQRIENSVQELLSYDWKVDIKSEELLQILADSINLKRKIKKQEEIKAPTNKEILQQTINDIEQQKDFFQQSKQHLDKNKKVFAEYEVNIINSISTLLSSLFETKQLDHIIHANQKAKSTVKLLENMRDELKNQLKTQQRHNQQETEEYQKQKELLQKIQKQIEEKVQLKDQRRKILNFETETCSVNEEARKKQYIQHLNLQNSQKIEKINSFEESNSFLGSSRSVSNSQETQRQPQQQEIKPQLKFKVINIPPSYFCDKIVGVSLSIVTLILLGALIVR